MLCVALLACASASANAQTDDPFKGLQEFVVRAYTAYQHRDQQTLLSLHSESSPYLAEFKEMIRQRFSQEEKVKIKGARVLPIKVDVQTDKATLRLAVKVIASDNETGNEAEGFPEWDHTLYLVQEQGAWKLWRFVDTAEEFTANYVAARTDAERAALLAKAEPFTGPFRRGLWDSGRELLEVKGDATNAILILNLGLKLSEQAKDIEGAAGALDALGDVAFAQGDYARAADLFQNVLKQCEDFGIKAGVAAMLTKMGNIHQVQGNDAIAMEYYQKSIQFYKELGSKIEITYPLAMIGDSYFSQLDYEKALENYQQSLKIYEQVFDRAGTAWLLNKIGQVYAALKKDQLAIEYYEKSQKLSEAFGNKAMTADSLSNVGVVRYQQGRYAESAAISSRAAQLARESNNPEVLWRTLTTNGQAYRALDQKDEAARSFLEAIAVIEKLRYQVVGNEREQQRFLENKTAPYNAMVELMIAKNNPAAAFLYAEAAKGRMLLDVLRNGRVDINKNMSPEERAQENTLRARVTTLNSQLRRESLLARVDQTHIDALGTQIQKARLEYDAYETRIYAAHPDLKVGRGESAPLSLNDAGALIDDSRAALLEYVVTEKQTYVFVLTKRDNSDNVRLKVYPIDITVHDLATRVADFRQRLAGNSADFKELAKELYGLLLQPAQGELEGKAEICIVPSETLWELPFQALLSKSNRYVLEDHALSYVPSLGILREMRQKALTEGAKSGDGSNAGSSSPTKVSATMPRLLAMGNPELSGSLVSQVKSIRRDVSLDSLPQAEQEVKALREIYGDQHSTILTGAAASEKTFKATASNYAVLHFATHGVLDDANPLYSRLLLATASQNEDGFLEAREIMNLDLHADLVVLSACQTARGHVGSGEGLIGMSWALFIAGTSTTLASQWRVDSTSTARLMVDFHRGLQTNKKVMRTGAAEALRKAALKLMADPRYRHPFFWSGFVVVGNAI
jgi:CHAT domain-containing protein